MAKTRVPIYGTTPPKSIQVDASATVGAQIGVNLLLPDGTLGTVDSLRKLFGSTADASSLNTTDDLEEGQWHLWFTDRRAQDAVGGILANSANVTLSYVAGTSITANLTNLADSGAGTLMATTFDAWGRKIGTRDATITGTAGRVTVANGSAAAGVPTIDLATVADAGGGALLRFVRDAWGRITGTSAATTSDLAEGTRLYYTDARADARITAQKGQPSGLASLDSGGKLDAGQIPALAITETFVVATQAAMLELTAQEGDVAVRTDLSKSFILTTSPASTLANWQELLTPTGGVASFNGRTGPVMPATGDYTAAQVGAEPTIATGTTAQYWRGDKGWRDFAPDVRAAVLTGLSTAASAVIAATDTLLGALGKLQAQITSNASIPAGYIDGLRLVWNSGTSISVTSGAAYIQGSSAVISSPSALTLASLSLTASTWYHVYLYLNAGTPAIECVTTAPATAYSGVARSKTGDTSRRYLGSVRAATGGAIVQFQHDAVNNSVSYLGADYSLRNLLNNGTASTVTTISAASMVPATGTAIDILITNVSNQVFVSSNSTAGLPLGSGAGNSYYGFANAGAGVGVPKHPVNTSQAITYKLLAAPSGIGAYIDLNGYTYER